MFQSPSAAGAAPKVVDAISICALIISAIILQTSTFSIVQLALVLIECIVLTIFMFFMALSLAYIYFQYVYQLPAEITHFPPVAMRYPRCHIHGG